MKGQIEAVSIKDKTVGIKIGDTWYSCFKDKWGNFNKDDTIEFEFKTTEDGRFNNITSEIKKIGGSTQESGEVSSEKRRSIVLSYAIDVDKFNAEKENRTIDKKKVFEHAKDFSRFVMGVDPSVENPQQPQTSPKIAEFALKCASAMIDKDNIGKWLAEAYGLDMSQPEAIQRVLENWEKYYGEFRNRKKEEDIQY